MKHTLSTATVVAALALAFSSAANAADGTITFTGTISAQTCTINGNGSGGTSFAVTLPTVAASALATDGATSGRTPFSIAVSGCSTKSGTVSTWFEPGATVDATTHRLTNGAPGGAANVQIGLLEKDATTAVHPGIASQKANIDTTTGDAKLDYFAEYVATGGPAGSGAVSSSVTYSMVYN